MLKKVLRAARKLGNEEILKYFSVALVREAVVFTNVRDKISF